jgi:hypothetical protein
VILLVIFIVTDNVPLTLTVDPAPMPDGITVSENIPVRPDLLRNTAVAGETGT